MRKYCCILGGVVLLITGCLAMFTGCGDERVEEEETVAVPPPAPEGMVLIPAGQLMGSNDEEAGNDEQPVRKVYVDAFYMDETEVTNAQFKEFLLENPHWQKDRIEDRFHNGLYMRGKFFPRDDLKGENL